MALSLGAIASVAAGNFFPPSYLYWVPSFALALLAGWRGLRSGGVGWWLACGWMAGTCACAVAARGPGGAGTSPLPVRYVAIVRDAWQESRFGWNNRFQVERLEARGKSLRGGGEFRVRVGGRVVGAELPEPGCRVEGSGELVYDPDLPLRRPFLRIESGLLLRRLTGGSTIDRLRQASMASLERAAAADVARLRAGGLAAALILGRRDGLLGSEVGELRSSGLAHLLAVSGLNVGMVAALAWGLLLGLRVPPAPRRLALVIVVVVFAMVSGGEAPVRRAAAATVAYLLARQFGRPLAPLPIVWGVVAGLLLLEPDAALQAGFQLSALVTLALVRWAVPVAEWITFAPRRLAQALGVAVTAQAAATPLVGIHFGSVPPLAVIANLLAAPVSFLLTAFSLAAVVLAPIDRVLGALALEAVAWGQWILDQIARCGSVRPWACPPFPSWLLVGLAAAGLLAVTRAAASRVAAPLVLAATVLWIVWPGSSGNSRSEVRMLPVTDGMSILLRVAENRILVDAGRSPTEAARELTRQRVRSLDALLITHPDVDHTGGARRVLETCRPHVLVYPQFGGPRAEMVELRRVARQVGTRELGVSAGQRLDFGGVRVHVLWPPVGFSGEDNDASLVSSVWLDGWRMLITGDLEARGEAALLHNGAPLLANVLQLPHHGSMTSSGSDFVAAVDPVVALSAAGVAPRFTYPHVVVRDRLRTMHVVVLAQTGGWSAVRAVGDWLEIDGRSPVRVRAERLSRAR